MDEDILRVGKGKEKAFSDTDLHTMHFLPRVQPPWLFSVLGLSPCLGVRSFKTLQVSKHSLYGLDPPFLKTHLVEVASHSLLANS